MSSDKEIECECWVNETQKSRGEVNARCSAHTKVKRSKFPKALLFRCFKLHFFFPFILDFVLFVSFVTIVDTIRTVVTTASPAPATAAATEIRRKLLWIFAATHLPILTFIGEFTVFRVRCATDKCINKNISSTNVNCMLNGYGLPQWVILVGCWECVCMRNDAWQMDRVAFQYLLL